MSLDVNEIDRIGPDGMVWSLYFQPGEQPVGASQAVVSQRLAGRALPDKSWLWLHFDAVPALATQRLGRLGWLPEIARDALIGADGGLRLEAEDGAVFGALPAFDDTLTDFDKELCAFRFALLPDLLITTRRRRVPALYRIYRSLVGGTEVASAAALIDLALLEFGGGLRNNIGELDDYLDQAEDVLLSDDRDSNLHHVGGVVGKTRRRSTMLRRVIAPMDRIMRSEDLALPEWAEEDLLDRSRRQLHAALDDLLALQDRARSLQDELAARQAEETNRRLYVVSVMTTLMLPATFVTGFFGMNTGGMFLSGSHAGTIEAGFVCFLFMAFTWLLMKRARIL